jgi:hypothetical protein
MAEKSTKEVRLKGFSAIAAIVAGSLILIGGWAILGQSLSLNPRSTSDTSVSAPGAINESTAISNAVTPSASESVLAQDFTPSNAQVVPGNTTRQGLLRVGNLSEHPVRVALLLKKGGSAKNDTTPNVRYEPPAHWDFAPGEGRTKGLLLSLPNRSIKVKKGDVLVAFAQDGSRRYWGPYVVGETETPNWNTNANEWELVLEP